MAKEIVEVNGIKIEVDMDTARRVEHYRIGDKVKLLKKEYQAYRSYPGIIVGFDAFKERPTIVVCYLDVSYSETKVAFAYINSETEDIEMAPMLNAEADLDKADAVGKLDSAINTKQAEVDELKRKRAYFLDNFNKHFVVELSDDK